MEQIKKLIKHPYAIYALISTIYIIQSLILGLIFSNGLIVFLGWNMVLASIVLVLTAILDASIIKRSLFFYVIGILWVLFYPNTFYILTDFIHIQDYQFFAVYPDVYQMTIEDWFVFYHITSGALIGLLYGVIAIQDVTKIVKEKLNINPLVIYFSMSVLSSIGIYIGRFLRFNSWHILNMIDMIQDIFQNTRFFIGFVSIFTVIHLMSYILFSKKVGRNL